MELVIVLGLIVGLAVFFVGGAIWFWSLVLVAASIVGYRAYRVRCKSCGQKVILGLDMKFCNQCGVEQTESKGVRLRCQACLALTRSELNLVFCNHCGTKI